MTNEVVGAVFKGSLIGGGMFLFGSCIGYISVAVGKIILNITERRKVSQELILDQDKLSTEHDNLSSEHSGLKEQQTKMETMLTFLKEEKNKELGRISEQRGSQLDIEKIVTQLTSLSMEVSELRIENANLKTENNSLRQYIAQFHSNASSADTEEFEL